MGEANDPSAAGFGRFSPVVRAWFLAAFAAGPTPVQRRAWEAIGQGENVLVVAPTGSGKTLAAFLFAIDELMQEKVAAPEGRAAAAADVPPAEDDGTPAKGERPKAGARRGLAPAESGRPRAKGVRVLYVSPLKALGADVERNLQEPLAGIAERLAAQGGGASPVRTGMRTGDTTPEERRALLRNPPDILITTPESLYLMLTSQAREVLRTVDDGRGGRGARRWRATKRGAHLALSAGAAGRPAGASRAARRASPRRCARREVVARFLGGRAARSRVVARGGAARPWTCGWWCRCAT